MADQPESVMLTFKVKRESAGGYIGKCVDVPAIIAQGDSLDEVRTNLEIMSAGYFMTLRKLSKPLPKTQSVIPAEQDGVIVERRTIAITPIAD